MRILSVTPYYEPEGGGLERYAHAILQRLGARGHEVRALAFTARSRAPDAPPATEVRDGVAVQRFEAAFRVSNTPVHPAFRSQVLRILRTWRPHVLLAHTPVPFPAERAVSAAAEAGVPSVVTYHSGRLEGGSPVLDLLAAMDRATTERRMLNRAARLVAVSPFVRDRTLSAHRAKVVLVPPGVDGTRFQPGPGPMPLPARPAPPTPSPMPGPSPGAEGRLEASVGFTHNARGLGPLLLPPGGSVSASPAGTEAGHDGAAPPFLFVGPLDDAYRWKGVDVLWAAFQLLARERPEAQLRLVGDGDRAAEFRRRMVRDRLEGRVTLAGRLPAEQLIEAYQRCTALVLPSITPAESFGMVLAEANACGRPVIGARMGGIPGFVRNGDNGLLVPPRDPVALAMAMAALLDDPQGADAMGRRGRLRVLAEHDWDDIVTKTERVLEEAVARRAGLGSRRPGRHPPGTPYGPAEAPHIGRGPART